MFQKFKDFLSMGETLFGKKMLKFRSDNGDEYTSGEYRSFLKEQGVKKEETVPYSPQQNGLAERTNRTIMEKVRSMLYGSKLPFKFWAEAVSTAVYLQNRSPTNYLGDITPYEKWYQKKPNVGHLRVIGCVAYAQIPSENRSKLDFKSRKCVFVGYPDGGKGYKLFDFTRNKMIRSRDVIFSEDDFQMLLSDKDQPDELFPDFWYFNVDGVDISDSPPSIVVVDETETVSDGLRRSDRDRSAPDRYGEWMEYASLAVNGEDEPKKLLGSNARKL